MRKKEGGRNQEISFLSESGLTQGCCISTDYQQNKKRQERNKEKMQPFFTDSQVFFRNFCRMIQVIRKIIAIGRKSGYFFQHKSISQQ